jgi:hypothetical protein
LELGGRTFVLGRMWWLVEVVHHCTPVGVVDDGGDSSAHPAGVVVVIT